MSEHAKQAMFENMEQSLSEMIADYLDSEGYKLDEAIALVCDPVSRDESELHLRMAKAAMEEYIKTVQEQTVKQ